MITRRRFLAGLGGMGAAGILNVPGSNLLGSLPKAKAGVPAFTDYKALVCIFMEGGNDSYNTFVPLGAGNNNNGFAEYNAIRTTMAVDGGNVLATPDLSTSNTLASNPYQWTGTLPADTIEEEMHYHYGVYSCFGGKIGINGLMPELAHLANSGQVALSLNTGTLVHDTTRTQYVDKTVELPPFLFAHNHQQRATQTGIANNLIANGWVGRIADTWSAGAGGVNGTSPLGLGISYRYNDRMMVGASSTPISLSAGTTPKYDGLQSGDGVTRNNVFRDMAGRNTGNDFERVYGTMLGGAMDVSEMLSSAYPGSTPFEVGGTYHFTDSYGLHGFAVPDANDMDFNSESKLSGDFIKQMESVANMIEIGKAEGLNRQVFLVTLGSFDHHSGQAKKHSLLLRELSLGISKFQKALVAMGAEDEVVTFTSSDFGRTLAHNGDGTDHAWGHHNMVITSAANYTNLGTNVDNLYGQVPDLTLDGPDDATDRGRFVPTLPLDRYLAQLALWFGVETGDISTIFPNLANFSTTEPISFLGETS